MACQTEFFTVSDKKTLRKRMISRHLCSKGQRFKHTLYEKDFKTSKKYQKRSFGGHKQLRSTNNLIF